MEAPTERIVVGSGHEAREIAVIRRGGGSPGLFWLGGYHSDMLGTKARAIDAFAAERGLAATRFDYSGHGRSGGSFTEGTITRWLEESRAAFDRCTEGPQVVIGSSMGGWLALLLADALRREGISRIAGLVLIAPAVDMTRALMWEQMKPAMRKNLMAEGQVARPSEYDGDGYVITRALIEDGDRHLFADRLIEAGCPVHILQGQRDPDVPWHHAAGLVERLASDDVVLTLVKDGDHRLSRPEDLERLNAAIAGIIDEGALP
jgi:alpha-beta hydrolase superfamily lysophospholipase